MSIVDDLNTQYKKTDLIMRGSDASLKSPRFGYSTGSLSLDKSLGSIGGIPAGRITEVWGLPYGGKTTIALSTIAKLQAKDSTAQAAYIDLENALDFDWARRVGIDLDRMYVVWPEFGEEAFGVCEALIRSGNVHIVVVDSVPSLSPRAEMEGNVGDAHVGLSSRLISQFLRKTAFAVRESQVAVVLINQVRTNIGKYTSGLSEPGGFGLKHHKSVSIFLKNVGPVQLSGNTIGSRIEFTIKKNKVADEDSIGTTVGFFEIWADRGVCYEADLLAQALSTGILEKKGSWIGLVGGDNIGQGEAKAIDYLTHNPKVVEEIERRLTNGA